MEGGHLFQGPPGNPPPYVCCVLCVSVHFASTGDCVLFTVKELMGRQLFSVNGCAADPVAFSELMVSFRVTAHVPAPLSSPQEHKLV